MPAFSFRVAPPRTGRPRDADGGSEGGAGTSSAIPGADSNISNSTKTDSKACQGALGNLEFEFKELVTVDEAVRRWHEALAAHVPPAPTVAAGLLDALGLALAAPVTAAGDVPGFDRSTVDGFAVAAADTYGASEAQPAYLTVTGEVPMGTAAGLSVGPGQAVRVATGGMLPSGADAALMIEYTEELPTGEIAASRPVSPGENIIRRAEDVAAGATVLAAGHTLRPQDLGLLAAVGVSTVDVHRRARVAVISTGDEIVPPEQEPAPGQVRDINSYALAGMIREAGAEPLLLGIVRDEPAAMREALTRAAAAADLVLISGGSSVGSRDYVAAALTALGPPGILVHGLRVRPGKPTVLAVAGDVPVIGLPGHPASALVIFWLFGVVAIRHLRGGGDRPHIVPSVRARLARHLPSSAGREDYVRVSLVPDPPAASVAPCPPAGGPAPPALLAEPAFGLSGLINTLVRGDGLVRVPLGSEGLAAGTEVEVLLFGGWSR